MHYLLIDKNPEMVKAWKSYFHGEPNVKIMEGDLTNVSCDAIVSPANSFGFMDGGVDYAISVRLGWHIQERLQRLIKASDLGEILVGQSITISTGDEVIPYLISSPTMRVPMSSNIATSMNAYLAMKATLIQAKNNKDIEFVAIPGFCTGVGRMPFNISALQMFLAFKEIEKGDKLDFQDWGQAQKHQLRINPTSMLYG